MEFSKTFAEYTILVESGKRTPQQMLMRLYFAMLEDIDFFEDLDAVLANCEIYNNLALKYGKEGCILFTKTRVLEWAPVASIRKPPQASGTRDDSEVAGSREGRNGRFTTPIWRDREFLHPCKWQPFQKNIYFCFSVPTYYRKGEGVLFIVTADWFLSLVKTCLRT